MGEGPKGSGGVQRERRREGPVGVYLDEKKERGIGDRGGGFEEEEPRRQLGISPIFFFFPSEERKKKSK